MQWNTAQVEEERLWDPRKVCAKRSDLIGSGYFLTVICHSSMIHTTWSPAKDGILYVETLLLLNISITWSVVKGRWVWSPYQQTEPSPVHRDEGREKETLYKSWVKTIEGFGETSSTIGLTGQADHDMTWLFNDGHLGFQSVTGNGGSRFSFGSAESFLTQDSNDTTTPETMR